MKSPNTDYIERLDHLRFYAAALVVMFHTLLLLRGPTSHANISLPIFEQGHIGVQIFMSISGFILGVITDGKRVNAIRFFYNRFLRIYPLLIVVVLLGYYSADLENPMNLFNLLIAMLPLSNISRLNYGEFGGQLWSIAVELQFYLLFPILARMLKLNGWIYYAGVIGFLIAIRSSVFILHGSVHYLSYFTIFGSLDVFLAGHLLGRYYHSSTAWHFRKPRWLAFSILLLNFSVWIAFSRSQFFHVREASGVSHDWLWIFWPDIAAALSCCLIITYLQSSLRIPFSSVIARFGKYSYSIYLWHVLVIELILHYIGHLNGTGDSYAVAIGVVLPMSLAFAAVSYHIIERPFLSWRVTYAVSDESR